MILKSFFGSLFLIFVISSIHAQEDKIDSLIRENNLVVAIETYQKLDKKTLTTYQCLELASLFSQVNKQKDSAFFYLDKLLLSDTSFSDVSTIYKSDLYYLLDDFRWDNWISKVLYNYDKKIKSIKNFDYCKSLVDLRIKDASFYRLVYFSESKYGKYSPTTGAIWELKERISRSNIAELECLIEKYGFPKLSEHGAFATIPIFLIQHAELETQKKYLPLFIDLYNAGEGYYSWVAMLTDRILLREHKPQRYGTQGVWNPNLNRYVLYEIENPEKVNELRAIYKLGDPISEESLKNMYNPNK